MVLIYNLADTFFIGQTKDALMIAAVSLVTPAFLLFMAVGTVFGIGGTSVITGIVMVIVIFAFMDPILKMLGAATSAFIINMSRQGLIYIPVIFILQSIIGKDGLLWAQPVADILSVVLVVILYRVTLKYKIHTQDPKTI